MMLSHKTQNNSTGYLVSLYYNSSSSKSSSGTEQTCQITMKQINNQKKAQAEKKTELQKEYLELSDKMFEEDVSDEEYNAMEKRQNEILDEVEPIN